MSQLPNSIEIVSTNSAAFLYGVKCGEIGFNECPPLSEDDLAAWEHGFQIGQQSAKNAGTKAVKLGPLVEELENHAQFDTLSLSAGLGKRNPLKPEYIGKDAKGRLCRTPADFQRAWKDNAYPVEVYEARPEE